MQKSLNFFPQKIIASLSKEKWQDELAAYFLLQLTSDDVLLYLTRRLARSLGEAGLIEPETEGILIENGIDFDDFPVEVLACLPQNLPWSIPEAELEYR